MEQSGLPVSRRTMFIASGLGTVAAAAIASLPASADISTLEKSNSQLVKDFCAAWGDDSPDAEKIVEQFMTDDCVVRFGETVAPVSGHTATLGLFNTFLGNGERYELKILETFARGPIVVNSRIDSTIKDSRRANPTRVVGVFVIKDGKIKEWSDYV
jgi:limonene-1,2-epoxide hydrolase